MAILNQYGQPWNSRPFARSITRDRHRGFLPDHRNRGVNELIPHKDRAALAALSRRMVWNLGVPKECVRQKASYSVGAAWMPQYHGEDAKRGEMAADWLRNEWFLAPDVRGGSEWWDLLELVSRCMDRDGESFILMTYRDDGWPALQHLPAHTIKSIPKYRADRKPERIKGGPWDGARIEDGVIHDDQLTPLGYRHYWGEQDDEYEDIPAGSIIHVFDREFPEQLRGYPAFSHALSDLVHSLESQELELLRQMLISSMFLVEKGDEIDPNDPAWDSVMNTTTGEGVLVETVQPGIRHISSGSSLETITHSNPGPAWTDFQDRVVKTTVTGMGWAVEMVWQGAGQGTAQRSAVVRCRQAIKARQRTLARFARRAVTYALAGGKAAGITGSAPNSMLWTFTLPARLSVDDGREDASTLEAVLEGACTLSEYLANKGKSRREFFLEGAMDRVDAERVAAEVSAREGIALEGKDLMPAVGAKTMPEEKKTDPVPES